MNEKEATVLRTIQYIDNETIYQGIKEDWITETTELAEGRNGVPYIEFPILSQFEFIRHGFSTRLGGVSTGIYESMNLSFQADDGRNVVKNFNRITQAIGTKPEVCVYSQQTHTTNVIRVGSTHRGMGVVRERSFHDVDGLITNEPGVCLVTAYADCVPLFFVDSVNKCIGAAHSGWRGTIADITKEVLSLMEKEYGTKPEEVYTMIGPSICVHCYEVSEDVAAQFEQAYAKESEKIVIPKNNGKYLLNLQLANFYNMVHAGIPVSHIGVSDLCTCCNPKLLYSHRASLGRRGVLCGFIELK